MKVVFHVVEYEEWDETLSNVRDVIKADPEALIEIIVMSRAAILFGRYAGYDFAGIEGNPRVTVSISEKALKDHKLDESLLSPSIKVEKLIITKLIRLQNEGYAYIRL
ncbi:hypothetical protein SAMN02745245_00647 [Anaerosphaera aminiphila DSM 21120]|uniref:DsrE/DsrF-like family protein n=1 Tax=Anaerosphaera aminiphila DSM 21120 TaxID=1120995 RepID=A0A1M5QKZ4_9FIRM|nr:hypothetical protein [Anaerosphaera aminiphila]SHH14727.1 hypothetical protein SAMN02745245_00647 [Anaerosphaera aminiphila DSM 21120]